MLNIYLFHLQGFGEYEQVEGLAVSTRLFLEVVDKLPISLLYKVCRSELHGRGVKTTRSFNKGDILCEYKGELIDQKEAERRELRKEAAGDLKCFTLFFSHWLVMLE